MGAHCSRFEASRLLPASSPGSRRAAHHHCWRTVTWQPCEAHRIRSPCKARPAAPGRTARPGPRALTAHLPRPGRLGTRSSSLCVPALHFSPPGRIPPSRAVPSSTLIFFSFWRTLPVSLTPFFIVPLSPCPTEPLPRAVFSGSRQQRPKSWSRGLSRTISAPRPRDPAKEDGSPFHSP